MGELGRHVDFAIQNLRISLDKGISFVLHARNYSRKNYLELDDADKVSFQRHLLDNSN